MRRQRTLAEYPLPDFHVVVRVAQGYDTASALSGFREGEATVLGIEVAQGFRFDWTPDAFRALHARSAAITPAGSTTPRFLRTLFDATYVDGALFVQRLHRAGGWPRVDAAWKRPPATTEQLLHPDTYDQEEERKARGPLLHELRGSEVTIVASAGSAAGSCQGVEFAWGWR